jgi:hypothetical protein
MSKAVEHNFIPVSEVLSRYDQRLASYVIAGQSRVSWWRRLLRLLRRLSWL